LCLWRGAEPWAVWQATHVKDPALHSNT
jgi:hypothetical protein